MGGKHLLVVDKEVISFLSKYLKKMRLYFVLIRVGIFRKFNVRGKFIPQPWSNRGNGPLTTYSVTVGQHKLIRRRPGLDFAQVSRGKHFVHILRGQIILLFEDMGCHIFSNLFLTGSQFIYLNSFNPIRDLFPKDRQNLIHLF